MLAEIEIYSTQVILPLVGILIALIAVIALRKFRTKSTGDARDYQPQIEISQEKLKSSLSGDHVEIGERIGKTKSNFASTLTKLRGKSTIDPTFWGEIEQMLLLSDVGIATTNHICETARNRVESKKIDNVDLAISEVKESIKELFVQNRDVELIDDQRNVWLFVGVNGVGKTTSIAKLAKKYSDNSKSVLLIAADTFRAAAADQLEKWADRVNVEIVRSSENADPASVVFNGMEKANAKNFDLVLVDTAGRLHTKSNLMEEIKKIKRVIERTQGALKEVLIVIDASTGQNGLVQAREFSQALGITGVILTKLDGSAKGGIVLAIEHDLGIPVKWVGLGESETDLVQFDPKGYVDAIIG